MWPRDRKWANALGKTGTYTCSTQDCHKPSICKKKKKNTLSSKCNKSKHNKMRCACKHNFQYLKWCRSKAMVHVFRLNVFCCFLQFQLGSGVSMTSEKAPEKTRMPFQGWILSWHIKICSLATFNFPEWIKLMLLINQSRRSSELKKKNSYSFLRF